MTIDEELGIKQPPQQQQALAATIPATNDVHHSAKTSTSSNQYNNASGSTSKWKSLGSRKVRFASHRSGKLVTHMLMLIIYDVQFLQLSLIILCKFQNALSSSSSNNKTKVVNTPYGE